MAALPLLLICLGALFVSANADQYSQLPVVKKKGVDLAVEMLNFEDHLMFSNRFSGESSSKDPGFHVTYTTREFNLEHTNCKKGVADTENCQVVHDKPVMNCFVCYKTFYNTIAEDPAPYVHCVEEEALTWEMGVMRTEECEKVKTKEFAPSPTPTLITNPTAGAP